MRARVVNARSLVTLSDIQALISGISQYLHPLAVPMAVVLLGIPCFLWGRRRRRLFLDKVWSEVARRLGASFESAAENVSDSGYRDLFLSRDGLQLRISGPGDAVEEMTFVVGGIDPRIHWTPKTLFASDGDHLLGNVVFDAAVVVQGERGVTLALLDAENQLEVIDAVKRGAVFEGGEIRLTLPTYSQKLSQKVFDRNRHIGKVQRMEEEARSLLAIAARLSARKEQGLPAGLLDGVLRDPHMAFRRKCLSELLTHHGTSREAHAAYQAIQAAENDYPDDLKLAVTIHLEMGHPGLETRLLDALRHAELRVRAVAVGALGISGTIAAVEPLRSVSDASLIDPARIAIAKIQARVVGAEPGQITLTLTWSPGFPWRHSRKLPAGSSVS